MQPIKERGPVSYFNKYEPGTKIRKVLGNTQKGDGYRFHREGHVQNTGRRNAEFASRRLKELFGLNLDLVKNPEKRGDPFVRLTRCSSVTRRAGGQARICSTISTSLPVEVVQGVQQAKLPTAL